jgi:hypothetical protein
MDKPIYKKKKINTRYNLEDFFSKENKRCNLILSLLNMKR